MLFGGDAKESTDLKKKLSNAMEQIVDLSNYLTLAQRARDEALAHIKESEKVVAKLKAKIEELVSDVETKRAANDEQLN